MHVLSSHCCANTGKLTACRRLFLQDYATGAFEANMEKRAEELQGILARLGPSFAKARLHIGICATISLQQCCRHAKVRKPHPPAADSCHV